MDPREWLFDKRVVRRNLDKGVLSMKAFNDYLKTLDDREDEYDFVELDAKPEDEEEAEAEDAEGETDEDAE
jgi:hypothetical protein